MSHHPVVHVVDDDESVRELLSQLLRTRGHEVKTYGSAEEFLAGRVESRGGCVLLDLQMPGLNGLKLQEALAVAPDPLPVVFLSGRADVHSSVEAMKAGAVDFLTKPVNVDELHAAVGRAMDLDRAARELREKSRELNLRIERLTPRERQVFALVVAGKLNKQIASQLGTTQRTIKAHRASVMKKLEADSLADLVRLAGQSGRLPLEPSPDGDALAFRGE